MILGKIKKIHFIGIGGIGMSGIAEVLLNMGFEISGSDIQRSPITDKLEKLGARVYYSHREKNIGGADIVVVSSAIKGNNPELLAAKKADIPVIPRSDMLGELMRIRTSIAVAGAHGKTTTTSMMAVVLEEAGFDPTAIVGGQVRSLKANAKLGTGDFLVAEVDESDGNFVNLSPTFSIITNIDLEHLDFYGSLENILDAFVTFARRVPFHGEVVCCIDNAHVRAIIPRIDRKIVTYGFDKAAEVRGRVLKRSYRGTEFEVFDNAKKLGKLLVPLPGDHNVQNALAVCALATDIGIKFSVVKRALRGFQGVSRRFERKGEACGVLFIDDYGHHPTEIKATLTAARENFEGRLVVVFQPHRYTRTRDLYDHFGDCFGSADELFITEIYSAGEKPIDGVSAELIYREVLKSGFKNVQYIPDKGKLEMALLQTLSKGDTVITLGAGDIYKLGERLLQSLRERCYED